jgi:hypothetical protein
VRAGPASSRETTAGSAPAMSTILVRLDASATSVTAPRGTPNAAASADRAALVALPPTARALTRTTSAPACSPPAPGCAEPGRTRMASRATSVWLGLAWPTVPTGSTGTGPAPIPVASDGAQSQGLHNAPPRYTTGGGHRQATADYRETRSARTSQRFTDGPGWGSARTCAGSGPVGHSHVGLDQRRRYQAGTFASLGRDSRALGCAGLRTSQGRRRHRRRSAPAGRASTDNDSG